MIRHRMVLYVSIFIFSSTSKQTQQEGCISGFLGLSCELRCPYPSYGIDCQQICICEKSHCNFQDGCIHFDGCENGFFGPKCLQECPYPSYGKDCQEICSCDNETCNHKHGCLNERDFISSIKQDSFDRIFTKTSEAITKKISNDLEVYDFKSSTIAQFHKYSSSTFNFSKSEVTQSTMSTFSTERNMPKWETDIKNEGILTSRNDFLLILIISLNTFFILTVCGIIGLCLYCKRKRLFHNLIHFDKEGNEYNGSRPHSKELLSHQKQVQLKRLDMTGRDEHYLQDITNDKLMSGSLKQERRHQPLEDENDPDPYLVPEPEESDSNNHQYLTVV